MNNDPRSICLSLARSFLFLCFVVSYSTLAGEPEPSEPPGFGTMKSLQEIYDKLDSVQSEVLGACAGQCDTDAFIPKTGQTTIHELGDDGTFQTGVSWPNPRFTNNGDGTTTDNLTGLVWLKSNNCIRGVNWSDAVTAANNLADGQCNLTDGSIAGDWRLPNIRELTSLIDYSQVVPSFPPGWESYFTYGSAGYWSSTTFANAPTGAWVLDAFVGRTFQIGKSLSCLDWDFGEGVTCQGDMHVWAVRGLSQP